MQRSAHMDKRQPAPDAAVPDDLPTRDTDRPMTPDELVRFEEDVIHSDSTVDDTENDPLAPTVPPN